MAFWNPDYAPVTGHFVLTLQTAPYVPVNTTVIGPAAATLTGLVPTIWNNASIYAPGVGAAVIAGEVPVMWNNASVYAPGVGAATMAGAEPTLAVA